MSPSAVRGHGQLREAELDAGIAALADALGHPPDPKMVLRLGLRGDGTWMLAVRTAVPATVPEYRLLPGMPGGPQLRINYHPLAESLAVIRGGAETLYLQIEAAGTKRLSDREAREKERLEQARKQHAAEEEAKRHYEEQRRRYKAVEWEKLPERAQILHHVALALESDDPAASARHLRAIARHMHVRGMEQPGTLPFPEANWWESPPPKATPAQNGSAAGQRTLVPEAQDAHQ